MVCLFYIFVKSQTLNIQQGASKSIIKNVTLSKVSSPPEVNHWVRRVLVRNNNSEGAGDPQYRWEKQYKAYLTIYATNNFISFLFNELLCHNKNGLHLQMLEILCTVNQMESFFF